MNSSFEKAVRPFVEVLSPIRQRATAAVTDAPSVGSRWGARATFNYNALANREDTTNTDGSINASTGLKDIVVTATEVYREYEIVKYGEFSSFERIKEVLFYAGSDRTLLIDYYIRIGFTLNDNTGLTVEDSGSRGNKPG